MVVVRLEIQTSLLALRRLTPVRMFLSTMKRYWGYLLSDVPTLCPVLLSSRRKQRNSLNSLGVPLPGTGNSSARHSS